MATVHSIRDQKPQADTRLRDDRPPSSGPLERRLHTCFSNAVLNASEKMLRESRSLLSDLFDEHPYAARQIFNIQSHCVEHAGPLMRDLAESFAQIVASPDRVRNSQTSDDEDLSGLSLMDDQAVSRKLIRISFRDKIQGKHTEQLHVFHARCAMVTKAQGGPIRDDLPALEALLEALIAVVMRIGEDGSSESQDHVSSIGVDIRLALLQKAEGLFIDEFRTAFKSAEKVLDECGVPSYSKKMEKEHRAARHEPQGVYIPAGSPSGSPGYPIQGQQIPPQAAGAHYPQSPGGAFAEGPGVHVSQPPVSHGHVPMVSPGYPMAVPPHLPVGHQAIMVSDEAVEKLVDVAKQLREERKARALAAILKEGRDNRSEAAEIKPDVTADDTSGAIEQTSQAQAPAEVQLDAPPVEEEAPPPTAKEPEIAKGPEPRVEKSSPTGPAQPPEFSPPPPVQANGMREWVIPESQVQTGMDYLMHHIPELLVPEPAQLARATQQRLGMSSYLFKLYAEDRELNADVRELLISLEPLFQKVALRDPRTLINPAHSVRMLMEEAVLLYSAPWAARWAESNAFQLFMALQNYDDRDLVINASMLRQQVEDHGLNLMLAQAAGRKILRRELAREVVRQSLGKLPENNRHFFETHMYRLGLNLLVKLGGTDVPAWGQFVALAKRMMELDPADSMTAIEVEGQVQALVASVQGPEKYVKLAMADWGKRESDLPHRAVDRTAALNALLHPGRWFIVNDREIGCLFSMSRDRNEVAFQIVFRARRTWKGTLDVFVQGLCDGSVRPLFNGDQMPALIRGLRQTESTTASRP